MDEEHGRQAQLWWMVGVGALLVLTAYYENLRPVEARSERGPAQLSVAPAGALPYSAVQSK